MSDTAPLISAINEESQIVYIQGKDANSSRRESIKIALGYLLCVVGGIVLGFSTTIPTDLKHKSAQLGRLSNVIGGVYFFAWSVSFYPQVWSNYNRQSVVGLSFDYQVYNIIGFGCYSVFNGLYYWSDKVQDKYMSKHHGHRNQIQLSDLLFAIHAFVLTAVTLWQIVVYERGTQKVSILCWVLCALSLLALAVMALICVIHPSQVFTWENYYQLIANVKLAVTLIKYIPQAILNYRRKSTEGMSIHNFILDLMGGSLSVAQLCLDAELTRDWSAITGDVAKFGLGAVTLVYDVILLVQHYILYNPNRRKY